MLSHKSRWLRDAVMLFAGGVIALGVVLVAALMSIYTGRGGDVEEE